MQRSILSLGQKKVTIHVEYTEQRMINSAINVKKKKETGGLIAI